MWQDAIESFQPLFTITFPEQPGKADKRAGESERMREQDSIRTIKGIGEKTEKLLGKLGIFTVGDFLRYYPRDYDEYQEPVEISQALPGKKAAVFVRLSGKVGVKNTGKLTVITASARQ